MQNKKLAWFLLIILSLVWGSSFILMKRGLDAFNSDEVAALRISIAFLFLVPFLIKYYKIDLKKYLPGLILMGVFGNLLPAFLFTKAETQISSSLTGMLNALTPLFTVLVGLFWLKIKPKAMQIVGIIIGFIGAACLMIFDTGSDSSKNVIYSLLVVAATFFYAISVCGIKKYLSDLNSITATVWAFCITGPISLIYLFGFSDFTIHVSTSPMAMSSLGYISILAIVGSALSVIAYNILIKNSGTVFAASCTYLIPVVAIGWGLFDGETVNFYQVFSIIVIILSVYLINRD
ncbi:MAG: DMT family transporter [Bacteroidia bacterium]|nr:DMT family transporter [Bacteroidia bacterium]